MVVLSSACSDTGQGCRVHPRALGREWRGLGGLLSSVLPGLLFGARVWIELHRAWVGYQDSCSKCVLNLEQRIQLFWYSGKRLSGCPPAEKPVICPGFAFRHLYAPDAVAEARLCWVLAEWENSPCPATFWVLQTDVHTGVRLGSQKERRLDWGFKRFWRRGSHAYSAESYAGQRSIFQKQSPAPCLHGHWWGVHLCAPSDLAGLMGRKTMVVVSESPWLFLNGSGFVEPESVQPTIGFFISPNLRQPW